MKFTPLEMMETYVKAEHTHRLALADVAPGIHCTPYAFFKKETDGSVPWVVSRVCDHAGGTLRLREDDPSKAVCPLHNWEFDFNTLSYSKIPNQRFEHIEKKSLPYAIEGGTLIYETKELGLRIPEKLLPKAKPVAAQLRHLTHASALLTLDGISLLTDPWFVGECLGCGWWLSRPPKADAWDLLQGTDILYISHNHPDHMHEETLSRAKRDVPIIVPEFDTGSVVKPLRAMGFTNVHALELKRLYRVNDTDMLISILPTGDQREDSALFVAKGDFTALFTVDCVGANQYVLPDHVDLLMTSFASGASGWPLCYEVLGPVSDRTRIVTKNRGNAQLEVMKYIAAAQPKVYIPYAGFFEEIAPRDAMIRAHNIKNKPQAMLERVRSKYPDTLGVNPLEHDLVTWKHGVATVSTVDRPPLFTYDEGIIGDYLDAQKTLMERFDLKKVADYFCQSEFRDKLILYLVLTDDDFGPQDTSVRIDFSTDPISYRSVDGNKLLAEFNALKDLGGYHHLLLKARTDSMWRIVQFGKPLEELSLGFQCRVDRKPDQHNGAFWRHYTAEGAPMLRRGEDHLLAKLLEGAEG